MGRYLSALFPDTSITIVGLLIFFIAFTAVVFWVFARKQAKLDGEMMARLPLEEAHHE